MEMLPGFARALVAALIATATIAGTAVAGATTTNSPHGKKRQEHADQAQEDRQALRDRQDMAGWWPSKDTENLNLHFGPFPIAPGQNNIQFSVLNQRPTVDGWITSFKPQLVYSVNGQCTGKPPRVDVVHLHHGVWLVNNYPTYAAGEEKTQIYTPKGFGYPYKLTDRWALTYMIHNLTPNPTSVCLIYDIGFIPATSPLANGIIPVRTQWMDVRGIGLPGVRRPPGHGHRRQVHLPRPGPDGLSRRRAPQPVDGAPGRDDRRHGRAPAPGRPLRQHVRHADHQRPAQDDAAVPFARALLRARRQRLVGRRDDGDAAELPRRGQAG